MEVVDRGCRDFFLSCLKFLDPATFSDCVTSRTIRSTRLPHPDVEQCVRESKFAPVNVTEPLQKGQHGVNVFDVYEMKQRRRVITETLLNGAIEKDSLPCAKHPSRIETRQQIKNKKYMLQVDFDAFYDSIPLPERIRMCFLFKKGKNFYCLLTLPTS